jgi:cytochrome b pre-mRNA-processing protein 3
MLWPFNHFWKPRVPLRGTIEAIYGMIVTQAREPSFYRELGVPDTVNGLTLGCSLGNFSAS